MSLQISLLGTFQTRLNDQPVGGLTSEKIQALLAYLALENDRSHDRDELGALLWPDKPQKLVRQNMRQALARLQKAVGDALLEVTRSTVTWQPECDVWLDTSAFAAALAFVQSHPHKHLYRCRRCAQRLETAVSSYRGELLSGLNSDSAPFEEWVTLKREWFHQEALHVLGHLTRRHLWLGDFAGARDLARRQVEMDPLREEAHRQLMEALARNGRIPEAQRHYHSLRRLLRDELDVEPAQETADLFARIRTGYLDPPAAAALPAGKTTVPVVNLPAYFTPFVGREEELAQIAERLDHPDCRLLTLLGPGGAGKSRLSVETGREKADEFVHGTSFVPLAAVSDVSGTVTAIAAAIELQFPPHAQSAPERRQALLNALRDKEMLLILDNLEQLLAVDGTAVVDFVLQLLAAPGLTLLLTSRQPLQLQAEWLLDIAGLSFPQEQTVDAGAHDAVQLFVQTARRQRAEFDLKPELTPVVIEICRSVAGMPLALELAASWIRAHDPAQIAAEIDRNLDFLTTTMRDVPDRHRSLRAVFVHSWDLLSDQERRVFQRLSLFRGGFSADAAAAVAGATPALLAGLVAKSLVQHAGDNRYDLHELLRQYAMEKLREDESEVARAQKQHAAYFLTYLEQEASRLFGPEHPDTVAAVFHDRDNVQRAWTWAIDRQQAALLRPAIPMLAELYYQRNLLQEGVRSFAAAAEMLTALGDTHLLPETAASAPELTDTLATVWLRQAEFHERLSQYLEARRLVEKSLTLFRALQTPGEQADCLKLLLLLARSAGDFAAARRHGEEGLLLADRAQDEQRQSALLAQLAVVEYLDKRYEAGLHVAEQALAICRRRQYLLGSAAVLNTMGLLDGALGRYEAAKQYYQEALTAYRAVNNQFVVGTIYNNLGLVAYLAQTYDEAEDWFYQAQQILAEVGDRYGEALTMYNRGRVAFSQGDYARAVALHSQGLAIRESMDRPYLCAISLLHIGRAEWARSQAAAAETALLRGLVLAIEAEATIMALHLLVSLAGVWLQWGQTEPALRLLLFARSHPQSEEAVTDFHVPEEADALIAGATAELSAPEVAAIRKEVEALDLNQIAAQVQAARPRKTSL